jgi:hypothetical protein
LGSRRLGSGHGQGLMYKRYAKDSKAEGGAWRVEGGAWSADW